jgi:hypothetical protein
LSEPRRARFRTRALETQTEEELDENFKPNELGIKDIISLWITQILQTYGDEESKDGAPVCEGSVDDLVGGPIFLALYPYFLKYGGVFKLAFGPKVFMVLSDPVIVREVLKEKPVRVFQRRPGGDFGAHHGPRGSFPRPTRCGRTGAGSSCRGSTRRGWTTWWVCSGTAPRSSLETSTKKSPPAAASRASTWRSVSVPCRWTSSV